MSLISIALERINKPPGSLGFTNSRQTEAFPRKIMSCRILQTRDEVIIVSRRSREDAEELQVVTFRSMPDDPVLYDGLPNRWSYTPDQDNDRHLPMSRLDRWRLDPEA